MPQVNTVLCLVSESPTSSTGLRFCKGLINRTGTALHIMPLRHTSEDEAEASLQALGARDWEEKDIETHVVPFPGTEEEVIATLRTHVRQKKVDLVVADPPEGERTVPPLSNALTRRLLERLPCPVLVSQRTASTDVNKIVVPTDLSEASFESLEVAATLARAYDASISLVHVINTSPYVALTDMDRLSMGDMTLSERRAHRKLKQFVAQGHFGETSIRTFVLFGEPARRIVRFIDDEAMDLLVLSSHGHQSTSDKPLGRVPSEILRRIACSTLLVPTNGRSPESDTDGADAQ